MNFEISRKLQRKEDHELGKERIDRKIGNMLMGIPGPSDSPMSIFSTATRANKRDDISWAAGR